MIENKHVIPFAIHNGIQFSPSFPCDFLDIKQLFLLKEKLLVTYFSFTA